MSDAKTALVISAQTADFVWRCGGAIAPHAELGYQVTVVCLYMDGQEHLWDYHANVAENRGNHFRRNFGDRSGGRAANFAERFQAVFPRTVDEL